MLEGKLGALLGDDVVFGEPGDLVFKPRDQWHTFWNAGDEPARILEIISPGGFEGFFVEFGRKLASGDFKPELLGDLAERYGLEVKPDSIPELCAEYGVEHPLFNPTEAG